MFYHWNVKNNLFSFSRTYCYCAPNRYGTLFSSVVCVSVYICVCARAPLVLCSICSPVCLLTSDLSLLSIASPLWLPWEGHGIGAGETTIRTRAQVPQAWRSIPHSSHLHNPCSSPPSLCYHCTVHWLCILSFYSLNALIPSDYSSNRSYWKVSKQRETFILKDASSYWTE